MHRFTLAAQANETVIDRQTGLMWTRDASLFDFSATWSEAFTRIQEINRAALYGYRDWRLPNRNELFSLISHHTVNPSLAPGNPFVNVFKSYYWTSSTCARLPDQAWYIHLGGARVFKGMKYDSYMVWPVRTVEGDDKADYFVQDKKTVLMKTGSLLIVIIPVKTVKYRPV